MNKKLEFGGYACFGLIVSIKNTGEVVPLHARKAYRRNGGIAPLILNLATKLGGSAVNVTPLPTQYALSRRVSWFQSRSGRFGVEPNFLPLLPGLEPQIVEPVS